MGSGDVTQEGGGNTITIDIPESRAEEVELRERTHKAFLEVVAEEGVRPSVIGKQTNITRTALSHFKSGKVLGLPSLLRLAKWLAARGKLGKVQGPHLSAFEEGDNTLDGASSVATRVLRLLASAQRAGRADLVTRVAAVSGEIEALAQKQSTIATELNNIEKALN